MSSDAEYLQATVGAALAKGVAECVCAGPDDPVAFLGNWLKAHVQNASIKQQVCEETARNESKFRQLAEESALEDASRKYLSTQRELVVQQIRECQGYPRDVWKSAAEAVVKHTAVGSAYAMVVSPPQEPEYVFEDEDGEEAPETDDEETEKPVEEDVAEGEEEPGDGEDVPKEEAAPAVDPESVVKDRWDYSRHHLEYVTACPDHQVHAVLEAPLLERPASKTEEGDEDAPVDLLPITMKILDELTPTLHVPCTLEEPRIKYLNGFPAIGAYFAAVTQQSSGVFSSILAADTLVPHGTGQPLSADDRDLIWELARAVAARLECYPAARIQARLQERKYASVNDIEDAVKALRKRGPAVADEDVDPEAAPEEQAAEEGEPAEAEGDATDADIDAMEEAEIDPEAEPAEKMAHFGKIVRYLQKKVAHLQASLVEAQNSLESETKCMDLVKGHIIERQDDALMELHSYFHAPAATLHVLKATFRLLAKEAAVTRAWHAMLQSINNSFFESLKAYNISTECDDATWKSIRCAYKGAGPLKAAQARWAYELPVSCLASVLMLFIRQARKSLKACRVVNTTEEAIAIATLKLEASQVELDAAQSAVDAAAAAEASAAAETADGVEEEEGK